MRRARSWAANCRRKCILAARWLVVCARSVLFRHMCRTLTLRRAPALAETSSAEAGTDRSVSIVRLIFKFFWCVRNVISHAYSGAQGPGISRYTYPVDRRQRAIAPHVQ